MRHRVSLFMGAGFRDFVTGTARCSSLVGTHYVPSNTGFGDLMRRLFAIALVALSLGCGDDTLSPVMTVDGQWTGVQNGYSLSLSLTQATTGEVTGTALIASTAFVADASVAGTFVYPNLTVTITPNGFVPVQYSGTMSATQATIDGRLNGSGITNLQVTVSKRR
jgi:hypothetical protein